jgi:SAM-dependent methyltransferase
MNDVIARYHEDTLRLAGQYESVPADVVHAAMLDLLPVAPGNLILDVGAGSGRDAGWFAGRGLDVVAVEPALAMRLEGQARHQHPQIRWLDDRLPGLGEVHRLGLSFDLILLSAVWMHVQPGDRARAFRKLVTLLKPGGLLYMTVRSGDASPERPMWETSPPEMEALARQHGMIAVRVATSPDELGRADVSWTSYAFKLPDDGSGALPLIRGIIMNDDKSSTYKLALLRAIAKIADTTPALGRPRADDDVVDVPLSLVALNWVRMYLPLVSAGLPQAPKNSGVDGLGFAKTGFQGLMSLGISAQDLRVGARFTGARAKAITQALAEARRTICDMPAYYIRLPNSQTPIFGVTRAGRLRANTDLVLEANALSEHGSLSVPGHIWRTLQRLGAWVDPVLTSEWSRLTRNYAERMALSVSTALVDDCLRWLDPARDTALARDVAQKLMASGRQVHCVWSGARLGSDNLDIDHCLPWSAWPCSDLWNLMPAKRQINQHMKKDKLPSAAALAGAREQVLDWWRGAWESDTALGPRFHREAEAALAQDSSSASGDYFVGLEWRRLRLRQDQQVQEWAGVSQR